MTISSQQIIGELVAKDYRTASIFKKRNIDFCCNGDRTIEEACDLKNININEVIDELNEVMNDSGTSTDYIAKLAPEDLADYIIEKHHTYVERRLPEIKTYLKKVAAVHGEHNPELIKIRDLFEASSGELAKHMKKEEMILFPFIRKMAKAKTSGEPLDAPHFGTAENPIRMMKEEHANEGERFSEIAKLSGNYSPPTHACNTYRVSYAMLREFEEDLHRHIHLENNILFPKALEMEKELFGHSQKDHINA
ncbi:iron-sulfur cluster repair di-iron protein [Ekhidna sp.]|uniref:iron-sulfur cluster repair di-iron protein n=1 Tax=Ekhidna sp. TaxID=2608089 RepID=UPI003CCB8C2B